MSRMQIGIHLPQYGRVAGPDAMTRAATHAEQLGFAGLWVSDHIVQPAAQDYPSPYLYDPLVTLTWAAAVTERIGLGTSVLVVPQHNPLELANMLASLDSLSGGRLIAGVGVGWSQGEYEALGYDFHDRGARLDEILRLWRAAWDDDPVTFHGDHYSFDDIRVLPKPAHRIPIWVGGSGERAHRRAVEHGDGFHLIGVTPEEAAAPIERLRRDRPEDAFVISLRTGWDPQGMDPDRIRRERDEYEAAGVSYVVAAPWRTDIDDWLRSMDRLADLVGPGSS
jgi:probable F420-dependent oxidoreductase